MKKIALIGTGSMGSAIMRAVCKKMGADGITVTNRTAEKGKAFAKETGAEFSASNVEAVKNAKYIFLGVKPVALNALLSEIGNAVSEEAVVISMAAGVKIETLKAYAKHIRYVRIMPNVPAQIGEAMTALCCNDDISEEELKDITEILSACGKVEQVPEKLMDCVTAVSGSGPAFVFMFIEAMADAAVRCGMPRAQAYTYAAQTVYGSAGLVLETGKHPGVLKDSVTSPGGTTIEGVAALEKDGFRNAVIDAVSAACEKSIAMGKK
ncbi:MAG: pyrroline-5-carboxylate reductase [Treponema sp.]|nr:pyrroline-5-carboxylate reductase [Treponema sp.]